MHREIGRFFRTFVKDKHTNWVRYVEIIENVINVTHHDTTGFTSIELHMNIKPTRLWEKWLPVKVDSNHMPHEQKLFLARAGS